ncbi:MAG TPA: CAP domain-containing protein [Coleofasciculaceae cyanobacterium]
MVMAQWLLATTAAWTSVLALLSQPVRVPSAVPGFSQSIAQISQATPNGRTTTPTVISTGAMEQSILQQINQYRQKKKLPLLATNSIITQQARQHSQTMASRRVMSHDGFSTRVANIGKSIAYRSAAENVAYNMGYSAPERQAVEGWLKSTGHRRNIEGNYNLTGIGVAKNAQGEYYFTQIFIKR